MHHFPNEEYFSPDINIIENVWGTIKHSSNVQTIQNRPHHEPERIASLPEHFIQSLYMNALIPNRFRQVIKSKGHTTKH